MKDLAERRHLIIYFFSFWAIILIVKIAQLQIFDSRYKERARRTTLSRNILYPSRGVIFDRNMSLLVTNAPLYDLEVIYKKVDHKMDTTEFCRLLGITKTQFIQNINKDWSKPAFHKAVPFTFLSKIRPDKFAMFYEHLYKFPGFYPVLKNIRTYPHQNAAHILGYLGEIDREGINISQGVYTLGDYIGITGIERALEPELRGLKGVTYTMKDNLGRDVGPFDDGKLDSMAVSGIDMMSSIDLDLQKYGELLMQHKRGSIVAIEPSTGEILAMISSPSYNPNSIALDKDRSLAFDSLLNDKTNKPFLDRSIMANYPPGSIFKTVLSLISLQKGITGPNRTIYCDGAYELDSRGKSVQKCHSHPTATSISSAIQYSCNSYFYQLVREFVNQYGAKSPGRGLDTLVSYLSDFGLGHRLGVENLSELPGFIPNSRFYDNLYKKEINGWRATYMLSLGIGQGELQVTTLQMANLASVIANRGYYFTPHLVKKYLNVNEPINEIYRTKKRVRIDSKYFPYVVDGMSLAVVAGTATAANVPGLDVCGKTGTSENPHGKDHSVFFGFAPKNNPKIAVAVFVENAGWGGEVATPIAGLMIEKYLNKSIPEYRKYLEDKMINFDLISEKGLPITQNQSPLQ